MMLTFLLLSIGLEVFYAQDNVITLNKVDLKALPSNILKNGDKLELTCSMKIIKTENVALRHQVSFYKDDKLIYHINSSAEHETYTLNPVRVSSSGYYKCRVMMEQQGKTSKEIEVKVTGLSKPILRLSKTEVTEGEDISVICESPEEEPPFVFTFIKIEQNTTKQEKTRMSNSNQSEVIFTIEEGERTLNFQCKIKILSVTEQETSPPSDFQEVTVAESFSTPEIKVFPSLNFTEGRNMTVECSVQMSSNISEPVEVIIHRDNTILESSKTGTVVYFQIATVNQMGNYICKAETKKTSKSSSVFISITELFPRPYLHYKDSSINEGDQLSLTCLVPNLPREISNIQNYYLLKIGGHKRLMNKEGEYNKTAIQMDSGLYTCEVTISNITKRSNEVVIKVYEQFTIPKIEVYPSLTSTEGRNMTVKCSVQMATTILEPVEITIQKDKTILETSKTGSVVYSHLATLSHTGNYMCKAKSKNITKTTRINISVIELFPEPQLHSNIKDSSMNEGELLSLSCLVPGLRDISSNQSYYLQQNSEPKKQLNETGEFTKVAMEVDSGLYVCEVTISNITKRSNEIYVKVYAPVSKPVLTHVFKGNGSMVLGQSFDLSCKSEMGTLPITYSLFRGPTPLGKIVVNRTEAAVFKVKTTRSQDLWPYQCQASNRNTASNQSSNILNITVIIPVKDANLLIYPTGGEVEEGTEVKLLCSVQGGSLPIIFEFYVNKGNDILLDSITSDVLPNAMLKIPSFSKKEDGIYFCKASNKAKQMQQSKYLSVKAVLARWKKAVIIVSVIFIILAAIAIIFHLYLNKSKKKGCSKVPTSE